LLRFFALSL